MVSFTISSEDYADALRLHMRQYWVCSLMPKLFMAVLLLLCVAAIVLSGIEPTVTSAAIGAMIAVACLPLLSYFVVLPYRARRTHRQQKTLHYPVEAAWGEQGYSASTKDTSGTISWSDYYGWSADDRMILFMRSPTLFQMLPRRAFRLGIETTRRSESRRGG